MKIRNLMCLGAMVYGLAVGSAVVAQDKKPAAGGSAEMDAMMAAMAKWMAPHEQHKNLEKMAGKWDASIKMWMDPAQPPTESKGVSVNTMILGGRYLEQQVTSEMMGMPYEGRGLTGYDNFRGIYFGTWIDNMGTGMMYSTGTSDSTGSTYTMTGKEDDPMTGEKDKPFREVMKWADANTMTFEMYSTIPGKGEVRVMEITYTRAK